MSHFLANLATAEPVDAAKLRAQVVDLQQSIRFHRALGAWVLCNALERDLANTRRALRRTEEREAREPVSGVQQVQT